VVRGAGDWFTLPPLLIQAEPARMEPGEPHSGNYPASTLRQMPQPHWWFGRRAVVCRLPGLQLPGTLESWVDVLGSRLYPR
jgi:hypothetical protein